MHRGTVAEPERGPDMFFRTRTRATRPQNQNSGGPEERARSDIHPGSWQASWRLAAACMRPPQGPAGRSLRLLALVIGQIRPTDLAVGRWARSSPPAAESSYRCPVPRCWPLGRRWECVLLCRFVFTVNKWMYCTVMDVEVDMDVQVHVHERFLWGSPLSWRVIVVLEQSQGTGAQGPKGIKHRRRRTGLADGGSRLVLGGGGPLPPLYHWHARRTITMATWHGNERRTTSTALQPPPSLLTRSRPRVVWCAATASASASAPACCRVSASGRACGARRGTLCDEGNAAGEQVPEGNSRGTEAPRDVLGHSGSGSGCRRGRGRVDVYVGRMGTG